MNYTRVIRRLAPAGRDHKSSGHKAKTNADVADVAQLTHETDLVTGYIEDHDVEQTDHEQGHHQRGDPAWGIQFDWLA